MSLSGHHRTTLERIFAHPLSHNIEWHDVISLFENLAAVEEMHDGKYKVTLGDRTEFFEAPRHHHGDVLTDQQVLDVRRMLTDAGITP
ncbi:MAG TPA: hypothetical protein VFZ97_14175 [Acidimicrobiales bacterium]